MSGALSLPQHPPSPLATSDAVLASNPQSCESSSPLPLLGCPPLTSCQVTDSGSASPHLAWKGARELARGKRRCFPDHLKSEPSRKQQTPSGTAVACLTMPRYHHPWGQPYSAAQSAACTATGKRGNLAPIRAMHLPLWLPADPPPRPPPSHLPFFMPSPLPPLGKGTVVAPFRPLLGLAHEAARPQDWRERSHAPHSPLARSQDPLWRLLSGLIRRSVSELPSIGA